MKVSSLAVLGYVGSIAVVVAVLNTIGILEDRLELTAGLLLLVGLMFAAAGGALVGDARSDRAVLGDFQWFLATAALTGAVGVLILGILEWESEGAALVIALVALILAGSAWAVRPHVFEQLALFPAVLGVLLSTVAVIQQPSSWDEASEGELSILPYVFVAYLACVAWAALGWRGLMQPRRTSFVLGVLGSYYSILFLGATNRWLAHALSMITVALVLAMAWLLRSRLLLVLGSLGLLFALPALMGSLMEGQNWQFLPLVVLVLGGLAVVAVARNARRNGAVRSGEPPGSGPDADR